MIVFDILITLIEDLILCISVFYLLNIYSKYILLLLLLLLSLETFVFNYVLLNNFLLLILMLVTIFLFIIISKKKFQLYYLMIIIIFIALLLLSNTIALLVTCLSYRVSITSISMNNSYFIFAVIVSKLIYLLISFIFCYFFRKDDYLKEIKNWWSFLIILILLILMINSFIESVIYNHTSLKTIYIFLIECILLIIISFCLLNRIQKETVLKIQMQHRLRKEHYKKVTYHILEQLSKQISTDKHMMKYYLLHIKNLLEDNKNDEALEFVENS